MFRTLFTLILLLNQTAPASFAQEAATDTTTPSTAAAPETITAEILAQRQSQAEKATDLEESIQATIIGLYNTASEELQRSIELEKRAKEFSAQLQNANDRVAQIDRQLASVETREPIPPSANSIEQLDQAVSERKQILETLKGVLQKIESETAGRANRRQTIRTRIAAIESQLTELESNLKAAAPTAEAQALTLAKRTEMLTRRQSLTSELPALKAEIALYDAEESLDLLRKQFDLTTRQVTLATAELKLAEDAASAQRERQAQQAVQAAQDAIMKAHPSLKELATENRQLAEENKSTAVSLDKFRTRRDAAQKTLDELKRTFKVTKKKVDSVGLPESVGAILRKQRSQLPNLRKLRQTLTELQSEIETAQLRIFDLGELRNGLIDVNEKATTFVTESLRPSDDQTRNQLVDQAAYFFQARKDILDPLIKAQNDKFDELTDLSVVTKQTTDVSSKFSDYIDQLVLWIRSAPSITEGFSLSVDNLKSLNGNAWLNSIATLTQDAQKNKALYALMALFAVVLAVVEVPLQQRLIKLGTDASRGSFLRFLPTIRALLVTILISLVLPVVAVFVAWRLSLYALNGQHSGMAQGFLVFALSFGPLLFFRQLCRPKGVAECHFEWPAASVRLLQRYLGWAMLLPVLAFLIAVIQAQGEPTVRNPVPRLLLIAAAALATFIYSRAFHPDRGVVAPFVHENQDESWLYRLRYVAYFFVALVPLSILTLACLGYEYTASQLAVRVFSSTIAMGLAVVVYGLVARLILVQRRKLSIAKAEQRRAKIIAAQEESESETPTTEPIDEDDDDPIEVIHAQTTQTRKFAGTVLVAAALASLWLIWSPVLPALNFLEKWPLWTSTVKVAETFTDDTGEHIRTREVPDPVTVAEMGLAIVIAIATFATAKNVPGLLEISILKRLPLQRSVRYAITTLGRYLIILVGMLIAFKTIGLRWNQIQWMATALTFGLAFGLQEMFANFVAGIIILFERPIRVGDIVTVDDVTGSVSKIRMRATTITNWDRKDYIVPNKDFITGRVLNWTLSDKVNRIVVTVGVAYGSDVELARRLLTRIAEDHPIVVDDPKPMTTFEAFDDSSLRFVLRCFISMADMPMRLQVVDDLHTTIDQAFRKAEIEIAFPQTDLHIREIPAISKAA